MIDRDGTEHVERLRSVRKGVVGQPPDIDRFHQRGGQHAPQLKLGVVAVVAILVLAGAFAFTRPSDGGDERSMGAPPATTTPMASAPPTTPETSTSNSVPIDTADLVGIARGVAQRLSPDRYGGTWTTPSADRQIVVVGMVEPYDSAALREALDAATPHADRVTVVTVPYAERRLQAWADEVNQLVGETVAARSLSKIAANLSPTDGTVEPPGLDQWPVVFVGSKTLDAATRGRIEAIVPPDALVMNDQLGPIVPRGR